MLVVVAKKFTGTSECLVCIQSAQRGRQVHREDVSEEERQDRWHVKSGQTMGREAHASDQEPTQID